MRQIRVLVTGGGGFLGSHLCDRLVDQGAEVICVDSFISGSKNNVRHLLDKKNFELIRHDVVEPILVDVDRIYNLACPSSPVFFQKNAVKTVKTNVMGAINMLENATHCKARLLQASTSEVYGDAREHPQKESYWGYLNPIGLRACHDEGKRVAETLVMDYHTQRKVDTRVARIFNTYGPRLALDDGRVISTFVLKALQGEPIHINGDGSQTRTFCYVDDMVDGLIRLMETENVHEPVNLGSPLEITIQDLAAKIIELSGSSSQIVNLPMPENEITRRRPDISRAEQLLAWTPVTDLETGLGRVIEDFRKRTT
ncbi:MAG: SDR family oxidoreductase [Desulfatibacillum sp.]|nr:SDR family oxidoreductase [Desulfatibacillum sp.]